MKKVILSALLASALCVTGVKAQTINFGPKVGGNLSWVSKLKYPNDNNTGINNARIFFHAGACGEYMFNDTWGVGVEALYTGIGNKKDDMNKLKLDYLTVPVLAKFHLPSVEGLSFHLGPQVGFLMSAKKSIESLNKKDVDAKKAFNDIDFAIVGGAEYAFDFGLIVGARYNFGVIDVAKDAFKEELSQNTDESYTNQFIQVYVGYNLAKVLAK